MSKLIFVSNRLIGGGSERVLVTLANEFDSKGYEVTIISYRSGETYPVNEGINIVCLDCNSTLKRIKMVRAIINNIKPDNIIAFEYFVNMQVIMACLGLGINIIVSERNDPAVRGGDFPNRVIRNLLYKYCNTLVCQTPDAKAYFPKKVQKHTVVIPNPIKSGLPSPWLGEREKVVVNFCRLEKQKNLPLLFDAFSDFHKLHNDYVLHIYGNGSERKNLDKYIYDNAYSNYITIFDSVPNIHEKVLKSAMFVSSSDYEGLSNSMIEAMAIGLPTVCTDCPVGGARMIINHGDNGMLVDVGNRDILGYTIAQIADNLDLQEKLSGNAVRVREILDLSSIVDKWEELVIDVKNR